MCVIAGQPRMNHIRPGKLAVTALVMLVALVLVVLGSPGWCAADERHVERPVAVDDDPYLWLEDIDGARARGWVDEHNAATERRLTALPDYEALFRDALAVLDSEVADSRGHACAVIGFITFGAIAPIRGGSSAGQRWRSSAASGRPGRPSSTLMRLPRPRANPGRSAARSGWSPITGGVSFAWPGRVVTRLRNASLTSRCAGLCRRRLQVAVREIERRVA